LVATLFAIPCLSSPAGAQMDAAPIPSALPGVTSISIANALGVLDYCLKNSLVSSTSTDQVLTGLASKPDAKSADYAAGQSGEMFGDGGKKFAIATAPSYLRSQACDLVLQKAKTFK
jgi:hypothetical protein